MTTGPTVKKGKSDQVVATPREFIRENHALWEIMDAVDEYESTTKPWALPWALKIPNWPEVWLAVGSNSAGRWYEHEPVIDISFSMYGSKLERWSGYQCMDAGYFEIPPGTDWREMKVRVR